MGPRPGPGSSPCNRRMSKLIFAKPKEGQDVYAMHRHSLCFWLPAKIMKVTQQKLSANYPVRNFASFFRSEVILKVFILIWVMLLFCILDDLHCPVPTKSKAPQQKF